MPGGLVTFDHVWKRFHRGPAHDSLRDLIPALLGRKKGGGDLAQDDFWAVQDVSFEVKPGQSLGIIGGNGAGKSTTLKLLTRILEPTRGRAEVRGRVGSLIEVSAGFHPDLSGRDNVFLQGAIMGMPQELIRRRFDEIVEFSGISAFIDTPVKRYSSGMNARLGFSIAVHLEPDVLIIDEVLSVGDAQFQAQAFDRIRRLIRSGDIPVVIVSHQLDRIIELCSEAIMLAKGGVAAHGRPTDVVRRYLGGSEEAAPESSSEVSGVQLVAVERHETAPVRSGALFPFRLTATIQDAIPEWMEIWVSVYDAASNALVYLVTHRQARIFDRGPGRHDEELVIRAALPSGVYRLQADLWNDQAGVTHHGPATFFEVIAEPGFTGTVQLSLGRPG